MDDSKVKATHCARATGGCCVAVYVILVLVAAIFIGSADDDTTGKKWFDVPKDFEAWPVCKQSADINGGTCADGWKSMAFNGESHCYKRLNEQYNYRRGKRACAELSMASLVSIHSNEENDFVFEIGKIEKEPILLGLYGPNDREEWSDGTTVDYKNWHDGEPNDHEGNEEPTTVMNLDIFGGLIFILIISLVGGIACLIAICVGVGMFMQGVKQQNQCCVGGAASVDGVVAGACCCNFASALGAVARGDTSQIGNIVVALVSVITLLISSIMSCMLCCSPNMAASPVVSAGGYGQPVVGTVVGVQQGTVVK